MSIDDLLVLRERVNKAISDRIHSERRELELRLARLDNFAPARTGKRGPRPGTKVAPKYRNPLNPLETWTGRGRQPRWVTAALKTGKKIADLSIDAVVSGRRRRRKPRKARS
ncbi:MAG TPA: H-NS histone family protein [Pseudolabrys sp.]|nr:H-NS histone family protein [Pseudolabrys sp.]